MIHSESKFKLTRKPHVCYRCGKQIPTKTNCYWFKTVAFRESDIGRNCWEEGYMCPECDAELNEGDGENE